jgi:protocatechuate 3,4-dioxygenase beta subunit
VREPADVRERVAEAASESIPDPAGAPAPTATATLIVRVRLMPDDRPVEGVLVCITGPQESLTDAAGETRFTVPSHTELRIRSVASTATTTGLAWGPRILCAGGGERVETVEVTRGGSLAGRVVDLQRRAVAGAIVEAWNSESFPFDTPPDRTTTADGEGRFALSHLGEDFVAAARGDGLCPSRGLRGKIHPGTEGADLELVVAPCVSVSGVVVDADGAPVAGAELSVGGNFGSSDRDGTHVPGVLRASWYGAKAVSDESGRFAVGGLSSGYRYQVDVSHREFLWQRADLSPTGDNRIVLDRGATVRGLVLGHDGAPLVGASVSAGIGWSRLASDVTDERGTFELRAVEPGESMLRASAPGHAYHVVQPFEVTDRTPFVEMRLERERRIAGRVLDADGRPAAGSMVRIEGDREVETPGTTYGERTTWEWAFDKHFQRADAEGRFAFEGLYDGQFRVRASEPENESLSVEVETRSGAEDLVLRLDPATTAKVVLAGRAFDLFTGEPVTRFSLLVMRPTEDESWGGRIREVDAPGGFFRVLGVDPGTSKLTFSAPGYARWHRGPIELELGEYELDVVFSPTRTLVLRVARADGGALGSTVLLSFRTPGGERIGVDFPGEGETSHLYAHSEPVRASGLPAARIVVVAAYRDETFEFEFDLRQPLGGVQELVLTPEPPRALRFLVLEGPPPDGFDASGFADEIEFLTHALAVGPSRMPKHDVAIRFEDDEARAIGTAALRPEAGEFEAEWSLGLTSAKSSGIQVPCIELELPPSVARAVVSCAGYRETAVDLRARRAKVFAAAWLER